MNISEVYIGPLFVGVLVLVVLLLPVYPDPISSYLPLGPADQGKSSAIGLNAMENTAFGALALGFAYLIGVVFDRVIDTVLASLEKHNRLRFTCKLRSPKEPKSSKIVSLADPFPEDALRAAVMLMTEPANAWIESLRTRIRLMRTAAFMFPALAFALAFKASSAPAPLFYGMLIAAIGLSVVAQAVLAHYDPIDRTQSPLPRIWLGTFAPPRTHEKSKLDDYETARKRTAGPRSVLFDIAFSAFSFYLAALIICTFALWAYMCISSDVPWKPLAYWVTFLLGLAIGLLSLWAWWRTSKTFMEYLIILKNAGSTGK